VVPLQHPFAQEAELQPPVVQTPEVHESPPGHCAQALPPVPHWPVVSLASGTHVVPAQHPLQLPALQEPPSPVPLHAPDWHTWPPPQEVQAEPAVPHSVLPWLAYGTQVVPLQHPLAQLPELQPPSVTAPQVPPWHIVPPVQVWQVAPFFPHCRLVVPPWQCPELSTHPVQLPPWQRPSALQVWPPLQATQAAPPEPQALLAPEPTPGFWQFPELSQQPVHVAAQAPPSPPPPSVLTLPPQAPAEHPCPLWHT
jgi:hypothetical protein